jgi:nucleotide-binding universal stress UspA family protein
MTGLPSVVSPEDQLMDYPGGTELRDFAYKNLKDPVPVQVNVAVGKPAEEILRVAREEGVDLIVMGTDGRTGVRHLLLGSVAEEVTRHASCPVFTVRIGAAAASSSMGSSSTPIGVAAQ